MNEKSHPLAVRSLSSMTIQPSAKPFPSSCRPAVIEVICFADGAALLSVARNRTPACILLDVHIPGKSGLDILKELRGEDYPAPIFIISGQGDIAMAVSAIKNGALDFIEKPFRGNEIVARLNEAIEAYARRQADRAASDIGSLHFPGREPLTRREREVLEQFTAGAPTRKPGAIWASARARSKTTARTS